MTSRVRVLALGWLAAFVYAYPGQMTAESFAYLRQTRSKFFSDDYAPAISSLWRVLELVFAGPAVLLVVQLTAFVIGAYAILRRWLDERPAALGAAAVVVAPPVLTGIAVISTHALAASLLMFGTGALLHEWRRAGFAALAVATAVVPALAAASIPIVLFAWRGTRPLALAAGLWFAITAAAIGGDEVLSKGRLRIAAPSPAEVLWLDGMHRDAAVVPRELPDDALKVGIPTRSSELQDGATRVLGVLSPLDAPWLWLALAMAAGWLVRKRRELLALVAAGVAGQLAIALTSADAAPAQVTWLAATVLIAAIAHRWSS